jgi:hypothetical protein
MKRMNHTMAVKKRVAVVVGSGFSSALTSSATPILGNKSIPTLDRLTEALLIHMEKLSNDKGTIPFESKSV